MHDELRRLDEELASGRLDADSYRRRRDELLAARLPDPPAPARPEPDLDGDDLDGDLDDSELDDAARELDLAPPTPPVGSEGRDDRGRADPGVAEGPGAPARDPFPPPFRWGDGSGTGSGDPSPDSTQVVAASLARAVEAAPERTQVVPAPGPGAAPPGGRADAAEPTQVVGRSRVRGADPRRATPGPPRSRPLAPPAAPAPPERTQFVPATALARAGERRAVPARETVPPWADERSAPPSDGRRQGRELFVRGTGPSAATIAGTAAVVLVVAVVLVLSFVLG